MQKGLLISRLGKTKNERIMTVYALVLSAVIIAAGISLAVSCIAVYKSGTSPFSRESVGAHLKATSPFTLLALAMTVGGGILSLALNIEAKKPASRISDMRTFLIFQNKLSAYAPSDEYLAAETEKKSTLFKLWLIFACTVAVISVPTLIYVLNFSRYTLDNYNTEVAYSAVAAFAAFILAIAAYFVLSVFMNRITASRTELIKAELKRIKAEGNTTVDDEAYALSKNEGHAKDIVRIAVITAAIVLIIMGVSNGGMADVLGKAVQICTECIGLG